MISEKLITAVKLSSKRRYQIAREAGVHPVVFSQIINGIRSVRYGDPRVIRIGAALGLDDNELFDAAKGERS